MQSTRKDIKNANFHPMSTTSHHPIFVPTTKFHRRNIITQLTRRDIKNAIFRPIPTTSLHPIVTTNSHAWLNIIMQSIRKTINNVNFQSNSTTFRHPIENIFPKSTNSLHRYFQQTAQTRFLLPARLQHMINLLLMPKQLQPPISLIHPLHPTIYRTFLLPTFHIVPPTKIHLRRNFWQIMTR